MTKEELLQSEDVPVLNAVVESGDETIIQTSRLGREVMQELRMLGTQAQPHIHVGHENPPSLNEVREMIEQVVEQHMSNLRSDIEQIVSEAFSNQK